MSNSDCSDRRADGALDADVLIVGAGPTGLSLALALHARGWNPLVIDQLAEGENTSRAAVVHARTLEVLHPLGVADRLLGLGLQAQRFTIRDRDRVLVPITFDSLPSPYPCTLMVSQAVTEQVLLERLIELGAAVVRPACLTGLTQDDQGATATLHDGRVVRARYVVGADGMHSTVRRQAGMGFSGGTYDDSFVLADVHLRGDLPRDEVILYFSAEGMVVVAPLPHGVHRVVATVKDAPPQPDRDCVQALLDARGPRQRAVAVTEVLWGSHFRVHHRLADSYRAGRILLAGDAAHVHSPAGGQGMNAGVLDAIHLAGALDEALRTGHEQALDAYSAARRRAARRVIRLADRLTRLATLPPGLRGVRNLALGALARVPRFRSALAWQLSGLIDRGAKAPAAPAAPAAPTSPQP